MKISDLTVSAILALAGVTPATAALNVIDPAYQASVYLTHHNSDAVTSYDWTADGDAYYMTTTGSFTFGGLHRYNGSTTNTVVAGNSQFGGASTVVIGANVYYNTSDFTNQYIYKYGPAGGGAAASQISTAANFSLHRSGSSLFITGSQNFGPNHIYSSAIDGSGNLASNPPLDLGETGGNSGPLAFDAAGNLYYAPGFGDSSIYRWTSAEVSAALSGLPGSGLSAAGHQWMTYATLYTIGGAASMVVDANGVIVLSLTDFSAGSTLVTFDVAADGTYGGNSSVILQSDGRLGEIRVHDGELYVADGNAIYKVIPEPSTALLGMISLALFIRRRRIR